ncbi:MAG TPA: putative photosynthetic complex assembly protein PuhE [Caldimonas sp.]|nr:putative photosynthetic complex assembly protein PuhE [Caldimonas sp.]
MDVLAPLSFTIFAWWFSTGLILVLVGRPPRTFRWTLLGATALAVLGFAGLRASSAVESTASAYCAFVCALLIWAWQEIAFLLGVVTGPRRSECPPDARGWRRAALAFQTLAHHELALLVLGAGVVAVTWQQPNRTGLWTFAILWTMRQSAKLNVFLGVRNFSEEFLPAHLAYLKSYFRRARMNALFPVVVTASTWLAVVLWQAALAAPAAAAPTAALAFPAALLSLAVLEHWFLVLPLPSVAMWSWSLRSRAPPGEDPIRRDPLDRLPAKTAL